jgi:hypothetical protein
MLDREGIEIGRRASTPASARHDGGSNTDGAGGVGETHVRAADGGDGVLTRPERKWRLATAAQDAILPRNEPEKKL